MPLGIDVVFKWGNQKKKDEPKKDEPPPTPVPQPNKKSCDSCESSGSCSTCDKSCESSCSTASLASKISGSSDVSKKSKKSRKSKVSVKKIKTAEHKVSEHKTTEHKSLNETPDLEAQTKFDDKRLMIFVRHAERLDRVFPSWLRLSNKNGDYRAFHKNLPSKLPQRNGGLDSFMNDPPLTRQGQNSASAVGKSFEEAKIQPAFIYCSPSLRCVETASCIAKSMTIRPKIRVEPGLFDYMGFYMEKLPIWMTLDEMNDADFEVDRGYKPILSAVSLIRQRSESQDAFYDRIDEVISRINKISSVGTVLVICHASVIDAGVRAALKLPKQVPTYHLFDSLHHRYPYSHPFVLEQDKDPFSFKEGKSILPPQTEDGNNYPFDRHFLLRPE